MADTSSECDGCDWPDTGGDCKHCPNEQIEKDDPPMQCTSKIRHVCHQNSPDCYFEEVEGDD